MIRNAIDIANHVESLLFSTISSSNRARRQEVNLAVGINQSRHIRERYGFTVDPIIAAGHGKGTYF